MTSTQTTESTSVSSTDGIHEPDGVRAWGVLKVLGSILLLCVFTLFFVERGFHQFATDPGLENAKSVWQPQKTSPGVNTRQAYDRERLQAAEQAQLEAYGWQDDDHQHLHIPISRAKEILAESQLKVDWPTSPGGGEMSSPGNQVLPDQPSTSQVQEKPQ